MLLSSYYRVVKGHFPLRVGWGGTILPHSVASMSTLREELPEW
jgi:hypothetical protein